MVWPKDKLTRFEMARILGARSLQIALGAPILVDTKQGDPLEVSKEEFIAKKVPITVKRKLPSGEHVVIDTKGAIENWIVDKKGEF